MCVCVSLSLALSTSLSTDQELVLPCMPLTQCLHGFSAITSNFCKNTSIEGFEEMVTVPKEGICLLLSNRRQNFYDARRECMTRGMDLARIRSYEAHVALKESRSWSKTSTPGYWLGLTKTRWYWYNGTISHHHPTLSWSADIYPKTLRS